jgi:hypothetical protein
MLDTSPVLTGGKLEYVMWSRVSVELSVAEDASEELATVLPNVFDKVIGNVASIVGLPTDEDFDC